jgi:uncharacterized protein (TIGR02231 family)
MTRFARAGLLAVALLLLAPATGLADDVDAESEVSKVVVYPDRARVTRTAKVQLGKGSHQILVAGLPTNIDVSSLRAEGRGTAKVTLGALDVRHNHGVEARGERARALLERIRDLEDADRELADADEAARFEQGYVQQLVSKSTTQLGQETLARDGRAREAGELVETLADRYRDAQAEIRRVRIARRDVAAQLEAVRAEYQQQTAGATSDDFRVAVAVEVKSAGSFTLELTYGAWGSSWSPSYDARLDPDGGKVAMTYGAWVQQGTGEDWGDVDLLLSTARPALGLQGPGLSPWILQQSAPPPKPGRSRSSGRAKRAEASYDYDDVASAPAMEPMPEEEIYYADESVAQATAVGTSIEFGIPGKVTVPGDGTRKRVTIANWSVDATIEYLATPAFTPFVWQTATIVNDQDWPLLAGELQAFMTDRYIGRSSIGQVPPGKELKLPFGVEERLAVERKLVSKGQGPKGAFGSKTSIEWKYSFELESFLDRPVTVKLQDRIPVSEYTRYVVKLYDESTPSDEQKDRGILIWNVDLKAKGKAEVKLEYAVAFPADEWPWGL